MARCLAAAAGLWAALVFVQGSAAAACPVGQIVVVDNDLPGSGYSEEKPENWTSYEPYACKNGVSTKNTFRYLTKYSGDGSSTGKAIWKPTIKIAGVYEVVSGYRASENRTESADYYLYGDEGEPAHKVISQKAPKEDSVCKYVNVGLTTCLPGGNCRLVLDGNDKLESAAADVTTFKLVECLPEPPANQPPVGNVDHVGCENLSGWAQDPDAPDQAIEVHAYFGGTPGAPSVALGLPLKADLWREDLCNALQSCDHGFFTPFPDALRDGVAREIHLYAIDSAGGPNPELPGSPVTLACEPPIPGAGGSGGEGSAPGESGGSSAGGSAETSGSGGSGSPAGGSAGQSDGGGPASWSGGGKGGAGGAGGAGGSLRPASGSLPATNQESSAEGGCGVRRGQDAGGSMLFLLGVLLLSRRGRSGLRLPPHASPWILAPCLASGAALSLDGLPVGCWF